MSWTRPSSTLPKPARSSDCPEGYAAFVPAPLPPKLTYSPELVLALSRADAALGELSGVGGQMPDPQLLDAPFKRQEALCSLAHRGRGREPLRPVCSTRSPPRTPSVPRDHLREVRSCISTLRFGVERLREEPLVARLHPRAARAPAARRGGRGAHPGRVPHLAELDRSARRDAGHRDLRARADVRAARARSPRGRRSSRSGAGCPTSCSAPWCTRSSRASTRSWAATGASAGCSSRCSSSSGSASRARCSTCRPSSRAIATSTTPCCSACARTPTGCRG